MNLNAEQFAVEVARSEGHATAATSPEVAPGYLNPRDGRRGQTVEALAFQIAQQMFNTWPVGEFPLNRLTCQLIQSFAWTQAVAIHVRDN